MDNDSLPIFTFLFGIIIGALLAGIIAAGAWPDNRTRISAVYQEQLTSELRKGHSYCQDERLRAVDDFYNRIRWEIK